MNSVEKIIEVNTDLIGPLFYRFLFKLYLSQSAYPPNDTALLFLSRGGIRLRYFYEQFLKQNGLDSALAYSDFYVSRMAIIKASLLTNYEAVYRDVLNEYGWFTVGEAVKVFFGKEVFDQWANQPGEADPGTQLNQDNLNQLLWGQSDSADYLRQVLLQQKELYLNYLERVVGTKKNVILVDTGWSGSILNYMQSLDRERDYTALFFGRYNYGQPELPWFNRVVGLEAEGRDYSRRKPVTAVFLNRHLIEGLCEIRWPSVTGYYKKENGLSNPIEGEAPESSVAPGPEEMQAYGVLKYIHAAKDGMDIQKIHNSAESAARKLHDKMRYPGKNDLAFFSVESRSADFGKELNVPFFIPPEHRVFCLKKKLKNIKNSLWPSGQIALEFPVSRPIVQYLYHRRYLLLRVFRKLGLINP